MATRGVFIGIDRYEHPAVDWLSCAARDATAFHALFTDTFKDRFELITDESATRAKIEALFEGLKKAEKDDTVVVYFSGHGSETHELVAYDSDPSRLEETAIPLGILSDWFSRIPARHVILILDCCFSGGAGSKVLMAEAKSKGLDSADSLLNQMVGTGRIIFTASTATEAAWELSRIGHGLLTHHLLEALQGVQEVLESGKIPIYRLLAYVTDRVISAANAIGKEQHPTVRGQIDGKLIWPVLKPGKTYAAAFPDRTQCRVTQDLTSLAALGFPAEVVSAWAESIPSLNALQLEAINDFGALAGDHLVVSAPTSSGKTLIGELAALKYSLERRRSLFLLPLKALVNDKHQHFVRTYGGYGIRTIRATGEIDDDIPDLMRGRYDICLLTYEKFASLVLAAPHILNQVGVVIIDEVQMIADLSRGANLEFVLTLLKMRRREGVEPQAIALSAVIGDTNGLERWLDARLLRRTERPVPLDEGLLLSDGTFRFTQSDGADEQTVPLIRPEHRKGSSQDWLVPLVRRLVQEGKQVIVFRETRGEARGCAAYLAQDLALAPATEALNALPQGDESLASGQLRSALTHGVAFHISDLDREERLVIEENFRARESKIRVLVATTTLAMGVNTPAEAVVIAGLEHPGNQPYSIAEYKNMAGRAGRLGFSERGTSVLLATSPREAHDFWNTYVNGQPEDIVSRFLDERTDPRTLILRVLGTVGRAATKGMGSSEIIEFLEASFGAYQRRSCVDTWKWDPLVIDRALGDLCTHKLIERQSDESWVLTELGKLAGRGGIEVESIIRVIDAFASSSPDSITDPALISATQITIELDDVYFPMNRKSVHKEPATWRSEIHNQGVVGAILNCLNRAKDAVAGTLRFKKAAACLLWITDQPMSAIESKLTQHGGKFDGAAGSVRGIAARTMDLLPPVARVAELLHPDLDLGERVHRLGVRLNLGIPSPMIEIGEQLGTQLNRADYLSLLRGGIVSFETIPTTDDATLLKMLSGNEQKLSLLRLAVTSRREVPRNPVLDRPVVPKYEP